MYSKFELSVQICYVGCYFNSLTTVKVYHYLKCALSFSSVYKEGGMGCPGSSCTPQKLQMTPRRQAYLKNGEEFIGILTYQRLKLLFEAIVLLSLVGMH